MRRPSGITIAAVLAATAMSYLIVVPLAIQLVTSVRGPFLPFGVSQARWTLENYQTLFGIGDELVWTLIITTVYVGGSSVISLLIGGTLAWLVVRTDMPWRAPVAALVMLPFVIPPIVLAQSYVLMLAPETGILNQILRVLPWWAGDRGPINPFTFVTVLVAQGMTGIVFPFMFLSPVFARMNGSLEEAGRTSGAKPLQVVRRLTIPILWPAILGVAILQTIFLIGALEIPLLFGQEALGGLFSLRLWHLLQPPGDLPKYGLAAAYGMVFLLITAVIFQMYRRSTRLAAAMAAITGKGYRPSRYQLGRRRIPILLGVACLLIGTSVLPLVALVWRSLTLNVEPLSIDNFLTYARLDAFGVVLTDPVFWGALWRTVIIATAASTISVAIAVISAFVVARGRPSFLSRALDLLATSSIAIPGAIAGFAALMLYLVTNRTLHLQGTLLILILTYSYRMAVSYQMGVAGIQQIGMELEESAAISGATRVQVLRRIVLPLIFPIVVVAWVGSFLLNAQEFTLAAFLSTSETRPLSFYLYSLVTPGAGNLHAPDQGAATALIFTALVFLVVAASWLIETQIRRRRALRLSDSPSPSAGSLPSVATTAGSADVAASQ